MSEEKPLQWKVAIITGASSGIGLETARTLARDGCDLSIAARSEKRLRKLADRIEEEEGSRVMVVPTDVRKEEDVEELVDRTIDEFGELDIVVNNAGVGGKGKVEDLDTEDFRTIMETNFYGAFFVARATIPYLRKSKGNLIFIGSRSGIHPDPDLPIYAASKWCLRGFALSLEADIGKEVALTFINPAEARTQISDGDDVPMREKFEKGEVMDPKEVAEVVSFAASQEPHTTISEVEIYWRGKLGSVFRSSRE